jgi:hypothetical protein
MWTVSNFRLHYNRNFQWILNCGALSPKALLLTQYSTWSRYWILCLKIIFALTRSVLRIYVTYVWHMSHMSHICDIFLETKVYFKIYWNLGECKTFSKKGHGLWWDWLSVMCTLLLRLTSLNTMLQCWTLYAVSIGDNTNRNSQHKMTKLLMAY